MLSSEKHASEKVWGHVTFVGGTVDSFSASQIMPVEPTLIPRPRAVKKGTKPRSGVLFGLG